MAGRMIGCDDMNRRNHIRGSFSHLFSAALFGLARLYGIPRGWIGAGLAFIYALLLGSVRFYTRGLPAPVMIHTAADFTIYLILLGMIGKI